MAQRYTADQSPLPRFIWGEALAEMPGELDERIFLTHTHAPRFICEIWETDEVPEVDSLDHSLVASWIERDGVKAWQCNAGFIAARWVWIDQVPSDPEIHALMKDAAMDYQFWNEVSGDVDDQNM